MAEEQPPPVDPSAAGPTPAEPATEPVVPAEPAPELAAPVEAAPDLAASVESVPDVAAAADPTADPVASADPAPVAAENPVDSSAFSIEDLLNQASFEDPSRIQSPDGEPTVAAPGTAEFKLPSFQQVMQEAQVSSIDLLRDVELNVKIELGRSRMMVEDVLKLSEGSVVELDKLAGDPVDVFVNDRLVARGEVLVLNDNFCVRVNEIVAGAKEEAL